MYFGPIHFKVIQKLPVRLHLPTLKGLIIDSVTKIQNQGKEVAIHL